MSGRVAIACGAAVAAASGCNGSGVQPSVAPSTSTPPTVAPAAIATQAPIADALDVVTGLTDQQLPAESAVVYDASTDPGHILGSPGGYRSRAAFADARLTPGVDPTQQEGDIEVGGTVEVYEDAGSAAADVDRQPDPVPGEHDVVSGNVLLRLAPRLTSAEVDAYRIGLQQVTGFVASTVP